MKNSTQAILASVPGLAAAARSAPWGIPPQFDRRHPPFRVARKGEIVEPDQADLPCPVPFEKIFLFFRNENGTI
jgi:hypothetical protein